MTDFDDRRCFNCGESGHLSSSCPSRQGSAEGIERPEWCGYCDVRTRLIDHGSYVERCQVCWAWPAKGTYPQQQLPQHQRCGGCRRIIYSWDEAPCDRHMEVAHA